MKRTFTLLLLLAGAFNLYAQSIEFSALGFTSNGDYITTPWTPEFGTDQDFSIEFSVRSDGWSGDPAVLSSKDWASGSNAGFNIALASSGIGIDVNVGDGSNRADLEAGVVNDGNWHHILVSADRDGELRLFVDGNLVQSTDMSGVGNIDSPYAFHIGQDGTGSYSDAASCEIVNLRIWDRAMDIADLAGVTCDEINILFPYILNLIHYWPMQEGSGTSIGDFVTMELSDFTGNPFWANGNIPALNVDFSFLTASSVVNFTNLSTDATFTFWDFGDGNISNQPNPTHTYLNTGSYSVQLVAGNGCQRDTVIKTVIIDNVGMLNGFDAAHLASTSRTDYLTTPYMPAFGTDQDFTVEFRVKSLGWDGDPAILSAKDWNAGTNPGFNIALAGNGVGIDVNVGDGTNRADLESGVINDGNWHHVLVSADRDGDLTLYVDGVQMQATDMSGIGDVNSQYSFNIGQDGTGDYPSFWSASGPTSEIAEIRIWDALLTPQETVICDTLTDAHPMWNNLLHYWKMNEGVGTVAADTKGGANAQWQNTEAWTLQNLYPPAGALFQPNILQSTVEFVNQSTSGNYFWSFGDGTVSTDANPSHTYLQIGDFDVELIVSSACSADTLKQTITISELSSNLLNSLDLDGQDDFVSFNDDTNFGTDQDFTLELLVRSSGWNSDPSILSNKDWGSGSNPGFIIAGKSNGTTWKFNIGDGSERIDLDGGTINDGKWHHLAISFDRDGEKALYQDGELLESSNIAFNGDINSGLNLAIGQDGTLNYGAFFNGQVAEVRVWNTALDSTTLVEYICGPDVDHPEYDKLIHYWRADEGAGTVVSDQMSNNDGTYNGDWTITLNDLDACADLVPLFEIGAGNALDFDGFNDHVSIPADPSLEIEENITLEAWVQARSLGQWESFLNYVQDNGSNESGFDFAFVGGKLRFRLMTVNMGGNAWNGNPGADVPLNEWVHVAGTYDGTSMRMYLNGVLMEEQFQSGAIDWEFKPVELRIGSYIDDNELYYWDGQVDEVRIWEKARTQDEIRESMCRRLSGDEEDLLAYYRMDERVGTTVFDLTGNGYNGEMGDMVPAEDRIVSGAGIGDTSVFVYDQNLNAQSLELGLSGSGSLTVSNATDNGEGIQVYRVDAAPHNANSIDAIASAHFGVVTGDPVGVTYDAVYDYADNAAAVSVESELFLAARKNAQGTLWTNTLATLDAGNDILEKDGLSSRKELVLARENADACPYVEDILQTEAGFSTIGLSWFTNADSTNIQYGISGFDLGNGLSVGAMLTDTTTLTDLTANTTYDVYFQAVCGVDSQSVWVGPFAVQTISCEPPTAPNVDLLNYNTVEFSWNSSDNAASYSIEWGPVGFQQGVGILIQNIEDTTYVLTGLPGMTSFEFYVRGLCGNAGDSDWIGPFTFMTGNSSTNELIESQLVVYPNPATDRMFIAFESSESGTADLQIRDMNGRLLQSEEVQLVQGANVLSQDLAAYPFGTYLLSVTINDRVLQTLIVK